MVKEIRKYTYKYKKVYDINVSLVQQFFINYPGGDCTSIANGLPGIFV